jgi:hypothetical protein
MTTERLREIARWLKVKIFRLTDAAKLTCTLTGATVWLLVLCVGIWWPKLNKPEAHGYEWFMNQVCPQSYAAWQKRAERIPLSQGPLFESCLNEARPETHR